MTANPFFFDSDFLTQVSTRIVNEVHGVCRVVYDLTRYVDQERSVVERVARLTRGSKPPGTIELE